MTTAATDGPSDVAEDMVIAHNLCEGATMGGGIVTQVGGRAHGRDLTPAVPVPLNSGGHDSVRNMF